MSTSSRAARPPIRILLLGMMASGKSTVGRLLAERLGVPFYDNDEVLKLRAGGVSGDVQVAAGTDALHAGEIAALHSVLAATAVTGGVVAVAAFAVLDPVARAALRESGGAVWLRAGAATLAERLAADSLTPRPSYSDDMAGWLRDAAAERAPLFARVAAVTVDVDDLKPWQVAQRALDGLELGAFGWLPGSFEGVVLDLDGLLVDTEVIWEEAKRRLYVERGIPYSIDDHRAVLGTSEEYTVSVFARRFGLGPESHAQTLHDYIGHAVALFAEGVPRLPGALELVTSLRGRVPLGLASNTRREIVMDTLESAGLMDCFDVIVTGDEVVPKPAPDIYLEACRQLGIEPSRSAAVEDSPTGVRAAKAAGLTCIGVPSDPGNPVPQADRTARNLAELIEPTA